MNNSNVSIIVTGHSLSVLQESSQEFIKRFNMETHDYKDCFKWCEDNNYNITNKNNFLPV